MIDCSLTKAQVRQLKERKAGKSGRLSRPCRGKRDLSHSRRCEENCHMAEDYIDELKKALREGWKQFFDALHPDHHQKLLEILRNAYLEEAQDVTQLTQHA